jgi:hypothetical protein
LIVLAVVLAGCSGITALQDTKSALQERGFGSVNVSPAGNSNDITVSVSVAADSSNATSDLAANVVWQSCHVRFDELQVTVHGTGGSESQNVYTFNKLQEMFGPRNPAWNKDTLHGTLVRVGVIVIVVAVVIVVGSVIAIVAVRRKHRRQRAGQWPPYGGGYGAVPGYPGGGYPGGPPGGGYPPAWPGNTPPSAGYPPAPTGYPPQQQPPPNPPQPYGYPPAPPFPPQYPPPPPSDPPYPTTPPAPPAEPGHHPDEEVPPGG